MGKRQTRIFRLDFHKHINTLPGREANILLTSQATFHGVILTIGPETLRFRDQRLKEHTFSLGEIEEIMLDRETEY